jgi:hypothetical protein
VARIAIDEPDVESAERRAERLERVLPDSLLLGDGQR